MRKKHDKEHVLQTGQELFREQGYHETGLSDILKACGMPKGSFYNFFDSKEDFAMKVIKRYEKFMVAYMSKFFEDESFSPLNRLKNFYWSTVEVNEKNDFRMGCLVQTLMTETAPIHDSLAEITDQVFNTWVRYISTVIEKGQKSGEIRTDYSAMELAEHIHCTMYGYQARGKASRSKSTFESWLKISFDFLKSDNT